MTHSDPIADFATRLRNAAAVRQTKVVLPGSNVKEAIAKVLKEEGYVTNVARDERNLTVELAAEDGRPRLSHASRVSKPGRRLYAASPDLQKVRAGLGIAIVSTSQGVMTAESARRRHLGGEVLLEVY